MEKSIFVVFIEKRENNVSDFFIELFDTEKKANEYINEVCDKYKKEKKNDGFSIGESNSLHPKERRVDVMNNKDFISLITINRVVDNKCFKGFKWVADSDDSNFHDESEKVFKTEKEAYLDMRNAALEKVKWNTEYSDIDDSHDLDESYIGYEIKFFKDKIIHESYSGTYTYQIVKVF